MTIDANAPILAPGPPPPVKRVNQHTPQGSRVHWSVEWKKPDVRPPETKVYDVLLVEAERRICDLARAAVHHAIVSGASEITFKITRSAAAKAWARQR